MRFLHAFPCVASLALALAIVPTGGGCGSSSAPPPASLVGDGLPASCNPLRSAGACILPFPNAIYLTPDTTTKTGFRVALAPETLPVVNVKNTALDPVRFNMADGFSPATPLVAYFPERIDPATLVPPDDAQHGLVPQAGTVVVDMTAKTLVAHFSEVDQTVQRDFDRQALMIRPLTRLLPNHRYAVGITRTVRTLAGGAPTPPPQFAAIADGHAPSDAMSQKQAARMPDILAALSAVGVPRENLVVAWDFVTASDEFLTSHVLSMRDQALAQVGPDGIAYTITSVEPNLNAKVLRRLRGTFTVPRFISQTDQTKPEAHLTFDAAGKPVLQGTYEAPFTVIVPAVAATQGPLPVVLFGHGLLGSGEGELGDASGGYMQDFANLKGYVLVATDWTGLSRWEDPLNAGANAAASAIMLDFNNLPWVTDRLQQSLINAMTLVRTMRGKIAKDAALTVTGQTGGAPAADATKLFYYGISLGGIMGGAFMGYDPDVLQGALNVGGGEWSLLFQRSGNWRAFKLIIGGSYPDYVDQQVILALAQTQFDFSDPITNAPHTLSDPLPGVPKKQILLQMGVGDAQVPNLASEIVARTEGLPLIGPSAVDVWGMTPVTGPQPNGFTTWDIHATPVPPTTNATPTFDNGVHNGIRALPKVEDQIDHFFKTGEVLQTCNGPCSPG